MGLEKARGRDGVGVGGSTMQATLEVEHGRELVHTAATEIRGAPRQVAVTGKCGLSHLSSHRRTIPGISK